jgi:hypothetical protein
MLAFLRSASSISTCEGCIVLPVWISVISPMKSAGNSNLLTLPDVYKNGIWIKPLSWTNIRLTSRDLMINIVRRSLQSKEDDLTGEQ